MDPKFDDSRSDWGRPIGPKTPDTYTLFFALSLRLGSIKIVITVHQFWTIVGQFFLGTGRVPGWSPTPPLANCHRDANRAVSGAILGQFGGQFWAPPGRPGAAREAPKPDIDCYVRQSIWTSNLTISGPSWEGRSGPKNILLTLTIA